MKFAILSIGSVVTSMQLSSTKLHLCVSSILGVLLEDERFQVFLLPLDSLLLRARWTRIDHTVEHAVDGEKGNGKMVVIRARIPVRLEHRRGHQHTETEENDHSNQGDCEVPPPKCSKHEHYHE